MPCQAGPGLENRLSQMDKAEPGQKINGWAGPNQSKAKFRVKIPNIQICLTGTFELEYSHCLLSAFMRY